MSENQNNENENPENEKGKAPEFDGEFDAERAARLIENLREEVRTLKDEKKSFQEREQEREDAEKSELERAQSEAEKAREEAANAKRDLYIAKAQAKHGISDEDAQEFLSDLSDEEKILARAERLAGLRPAEESGGDNGGDGGEETGETGEIEVSSKPKPGLTPGSGGGEDTPQIDEAAIVKAARERRGY